MTSMVVYIRVTSVVGPGRFLRNRITTRSKMHGRVKVRTTEEQKEIARKEKIVKAAAFRETMTKILENRSAGIHDQQALNLTWSLLNENPDAITLWNYRREIFLHMKNDNSKEEQQKLLEKDLTLTEQCLRVNPKSYGSWHHRIWILDNLPNPDWTKELKLCTRYLQLDERNFHCWDYRRIIAERAQVPDESEYEYTLEKIESNFSNYSAWHLRSKLLPRIFPDGENRFPIDESKHKEELELVENAAFTDPNDQSAWFYLRWLLGLKEPRIGFLHAEYRMNDNTLMVVTSKCVKLSMDEEVKFGPRILVVLNGDRLKGSWTTTSHQPMSCVWSFKPDSKIRSDDTIVLVLEENQIERERVELIGAKDFTAVALSFLPEFSPDLMDTITNQLSSCEQLIELEPESKWTLLTRVFLMSCIDREKYEEDIKRGLVDLVKVDPLRKGYYQDLRSRLVVEMEVAKNPHSRSFELKGESLTAVYHGQYLWNREEINLSNNDLSSESTSLLYPLLRCKRLDLTGNKIRNINEFPALPELEFLSLEGNSIDQFDFDWLERFPRLTHVSLRGNPVAGKLNLSNYRGSIQIDCSSS